MDQQWISLSNYILPGLKTVAPRGAHFFHIIILYYFHGGSSTIGAKPNLYCEAIELVCGGSPKICVLVERKSLHRVKSER